MRPCPGIVGLHCRSISVFWALAIGVIIDYNHVAMFAYPYLVRREDDVRGEVEIFTRFCGIKQSHGA